MRWTDEAVFQLLGSFSKRFMYIQREKKKDAVQPLNRFGGGTVMFWGGLSYYGFGDSPGSGVRKGARIKKILKEMFSRFCRLSREN